MLIGHWGVALAGASSRRSPGLAVLSLAGQVCDISFFILALAGVERFHFVPGATASNWLWLDSVPYSHSLAGSLLLGLLLGVPVWLVTRRVAAALITVAVVVSHWFLDLLVHRSDLTLAGSPPMLGLSLWNFPTIERVMEFGLLGAGLVLYLRKTKAASSGAWPAIGIFVGLLLLLQMFDWLGPRTTRADSSTSISALAVFIFIAAVGMWVDRTRRFRHARA